MGHDRPRISCIWCAASSLKPRPLLFAVLAATISCATRHTPSLMTSVQITATDARYCGPSRVLHQ